jgi:hypothetical protein
VPHYQLWDGPAEDAVHGLNFNYIISLPHVSCITASMHFRAALDDVELAIERIIDAVHTVLYLEWSLPW